MHAGDVLGHEFMGVVEQAGPGVTSVRPGAWLGGAFDSAWRGDGAGKALQLVPAMANAQQHN